MKDKAEKKIYNKNYFAKLPKTKRAEYARKYYLKNREKIKAKTNDYYHKFKQKRSIIRRKHHLKKTFGITLEKYNQLLEEQNGMCGVCQEKQTLNLAVDHDHKTNKVRGLLCYRCNMGLGYFRDKPLFLKGAINYLKKYEHQ